MFTLTDKEVGSLLTDEKCFNDLYDLYMYRNFKNKLVLVLEDQIVYELPLKMISVKWAVACAERCLHIFEEKIPDDNRPRLAIEAARQWIIDPTANAASAADSAHATANNAYAAAAVYYAANAAVYAAAYTAYAADAADNIYAAVYADYAIANAARAAARSADAYVDADAEQKWSRNKLKEIIGEYLNDYKRDLKNTLIRNIIPELSDIIINYVV